ncbi:MAG: hypothetical protein WC882_05005 [Candidatus Gracilibacteria bacterium]
MMKPALVLKIAWGYCLLIQIAIFTIAGLIQKGIIHFEPVFGENIATANLLFYILVGISALMLVGQIFVYKKLETLKTLPPEQQEALSKEKMTFQLLTIALPDSVAIYGFILFLITGFTTKGFGMMIVGLIAFLAVYPRENMQTI